MSKYDFRSLFRHVSSPKFISHAFFPKNLQEDVLQQKAGINQERKQYWEIIWEIRIPTEGRAEGIPRVTAVQLCWSRSEQSRSYFFRKITLIAKQTQLSTLRGEVNTWCKAWHWTNYKFTENKQIKNGIFITQRKAKCCIGKEL